MLMWRVGVWVCRSGDVVNTWAKNLKCFQYLSLGKSRPFLQCQISRCNNIDGFSPAIKCCSALKAYAGMEVYTCTVCVEPERAKAAAIPD